MDVKFNGFEIAVIGLSGRFYQSQSIDQFWQNLVQENELITPFYQPDSGPENSDSSSVKSGSVLDGVDQFDAKFFGFNPREAELMDPQHRLFLECAWEALENAGYDSDQETRPIGIYAGVGISTYFLHNLHANRAQLSTLTPLQMMVGIDKDFLPTRASYKLNLKGPSVSVQSACSSSLVAVHLACQSLLSGDCDLALGAGVSVKVPQDETTLAPGEIISPDGHCRAFDAQANGTLGGNGIGVVVLKRLEDAMADRDHIYAVIKGSAINNDGDLKVGYTAPSEEGQAKAIHAAQVAADVDPATITYMEAHGTGTPLGDPIEIAAMTRAFRAGTEDQACQGQQYCAVGSVKTNVGHLDTAAGIVGLIKTCLALHHKVIPPSLNFDTPNPQIDFANSPFYVNTEATAWMPPNNLPRRAGVSSFGFGGTNAHVVLEEAPTLPITAPELNTIPDGSAQLLVLSAKTETALATRQTQLLQHLQAKPELNLGDVAYTLQQGRRQFKYRQAIVASRLEQAIEQLQSPSKSSPHSSPIAEDLQPIPAVPPPVVFMFTGQGAQSVNMARELYDTEPVFRATCNRCFDLIKPHLPEDLATVLYPPSELSTDKFGANGRPPGEIQPGADPHPFSRLEQLINQTAYSQPALFIVEYALAQLWLAWGIKPAAMIGHSIGEYVAACLGGVFSLESALKLVAERGRLMETCEPGAMLAVSIKAAPLQELLSNLATQGYPLEHAVSNSPLSQVVSGSDAGITALEERLAQQNILCRRLKTSHAFHSATMEPILGAFIQVVEQTERQKPTIPWVSNLTGTWITKAEATGPHYWAQHLRHTVKFANGIGELCTNPDYIFLEVGPGQVLTRLVKQQAPERQVLNSLPHVLEKGSDRTCMLQQLAQLWLAGVTVNWAKFSEDKALARVPLPTYPFERQRYWIDAPDQGIIPVPGNQSAQAGSFTAAQDPQPQDIADWFYVPSWKRSVAPLLGEIDPERLPSRWLIFIDPDGLSLKISQVLEQYDRPVIQVLIGDQFVPTNDLTYQINPHHSEDYHQLLNAILGPDSSSDQSLGIIHGWNLTLDPSLEEAQTLGFYSLVYLAQAIGQRITQDQVSLQVLSNQAYAITGSEVICPAKATLTGPCKVINQEYGNITCRQIDLPVVSRESQQLSSLLSAVMAEIVAGTLGAMQRPESPPEYLPENLETTIAYRGRYRWIPALEPLQVEASPSTSPLQHQGIYLITGGTGGIGLALAHHLAQTYQARLVLVGRSGFPDRDTWQQRLENAPESDLLAQKIEQIQTLEALGAQVQVVQADVSNLDQMTQVAAQIQQQWGAVHGIFHAAGVPGKGIIQLKTPDLLASVLKPKVEGTMVLTQVFQTHQPDFMVVFSSLSTLIGGLGQVDYCGANAFLDAVAESTDLATQTRIIAIDWDAWQEVGMGADQVQRSDAAQAQHNALLDRGIPPAKGIEILMRVLEQRLSRVVISPRPHSLFNQSLTQLAQTLEQALIPSQTETTQVASPGGKYERTLKTPYVAPRTPLEEEVAQLWTELLGIEPIGIEDNFFEIGGHSLLAVQIVSRLRERYGVDLPLRTLLSEAPTIAGMAGTIAQNLPNSDQLDDMNQLLSEIENLSVEEARAQLLASQQPLA